MVLAIIGGVTILAAVGVSHYQSAKNSKAAELQEIEMNLAAYEKIITSFETLKKNLEISKNNIGYGKNVFANGGYKYDGLPLANSEIKNSISKLDASITTVGKLINIYVGEKNKLTERKKRLQ